MKHNYAEQSLNFFSLSWTINRLKQFDNFKYMKEFYFWPYFRLTLFHPKCINKSLEIENKYLDNRTHTLLAFAFFTKNSVFLCHFRSLVIIVPISFVSTINLLE